MSANFAPGDTVQIAAWAKPANAQRVREYTHGTVNDTFEVVGYVPEIDVPSVYSAAAFWITPVNKPFSTVCFFGYELVCASSADIINEAEFTLPPIDLEEPI